MYGFGYGPKLDIKEDYMFKKVFGDRDDNPILISFLNAVFKEVLGQEKLVTSVKMLNSELVREVSDAKTVILDIQAKTNDGTYIDVELQRSYASDLLSRFLLYGAMQLCKHSIKGNKSKTMKDKNSAAVNIVPKIISIWILDCVVKELEELDKEISLGTVTSQMRRNRMKQVNTPNFMIIPIELPKLKKYQSVTPELMSWLNFFKKSENVNTPMEIEEIKDAYEKMLSIGGNNTYLSYLEAREKYEIDKAAKYKDALAAREEKGRAEGLAEGKKEGLAEGEYKKAIETAKKMLSDGMSEDTVAKYSGLSMDEIKRLKD